MTRIRSAQLLARRHRGAALAGGHRLRGVEREAGHVARASRPRGRGSAPGTRAPRRPRRRSRAAWRAPRCSSMSAGTPAKWTGTIARVRARDRALDRGRVDVVVRRPHVDEHRRARRGSAPPPPVAANVSVGTITSSPGPTPDRLEREVERRGARVHDDAVGRAGRRREARLELLRSRAGGEPPGAEDLDDGVNLGARDVRQREGEELRARRLAPPRPESRGAAGSRLAARGTRLSCVRSRVPAETVGMRRAPDSAAEGSTEFGAGATAAPGDPRGGRRRASRSASRRCARRSNAPDRGARRARRAAGRARRSRRSPPSLTQRARPRSPSRRARPRRGRRPRRPPSPRTRAPGSARRPRDAAADLVPQDGEPRERREARRPRRSDAAEAGREDRRGRRGARTPCATIAQRNGAQASIATANER